MSEIEDDTTISNQCLLLRRVPPVLNNYVIWDDNLNRFRPSSAAFDDTELSVVLGDVLIQAGRDFEEALGAYPEFLLVSIKAQFIRKLNLPIVRDPTEQEPAHGLVHGKKTKSIRSTIAKESNWIVEPNISHLQ